jgi:putative hydrolase of the HAD superfamily
MTIRVIGFDADDTLWHNETIFHLSEQRFVELLAPHAPSADLAERLIETERRNLRLYGYGIKGFTLSMIETALTVAGPGLPSATVAEILAIGRAMLDHPVEPLPAVVETLAELGRRDLPLVLISKGDLLDQEQKVARSGLAERFAAIEIVSEKTPETYTRIFGRLGAADGEAVMVGNSVVSDVLPAIRAGHWGFHVPYALTWAHERAEIPAGLARHRRLESIREVPAAIDEIGGG